MKVSQASGKFQAYLESPGNFRSFCSLKFQKVRNGLTKRVLEGLAGMRKSLKGLFHRALGRLSEGCGKVPNSSARSSI